MRAPVLAVLALLATGASRGGCDGERPPYDPCAGKGCGDACTACPPGAADCAETAVVKACDPQGRCVAQVPDLCGASEAPHPDCAGKACGRSCNPCGPERTCPTLVATGCDRLGRCVTDLGWLCYDPCAGKACGAACRACPPDAADCVETMELKACDRAGRCVSATPSLTCR